MKNTFTLLFFLAICVTGANAQKVTGNTMPHIVKSDNNLDRKSTRLNSSHSQISYAVFCLKKTDRRREDQGLVSFRRADRVRADDDPEDREGSVECADHEVPADDRADVRDFVVLPDSATPSPEIHVIRSGSQVSRGWSVRVVPRPPALDRDSGSSPERNRVFRRLCLGTPARRIGGSRRHPPGRPGREIRPSGHPSALWPTGWRSPSSRKRSPSTWTS